ncbi:hypothetical protein RBSWK_06146 [Rhodopirellula baltica SWK14]|uniref:Uncharacterized protein n=1 Tax=Rhodopirellula baltica SWK14 TaxID=993516 RepID=L7C7R9_RHOBT|nr:hypothetical protein RBSWK_06146 [Rhodopirellula baltica SWK14]
MMRSFGGMSVTSVFVVVIMRIDGGWWRVCFNYAGFFAADKAESCRCKNECEEFA